TRCIDSILAQTYRHLEIILVDDGSTDDSGSICDTYAVKDNRIQVIHQDNAGISLARNAGILLSKGHYLQFCDSDDSMMPNLTERLLKGMDDSGADMSICGIQRQWENKSIDYNYLGTEDKLCNNEEFLQALAHYNCHEFFGGNYNKLYKAADVRQKLAFLPKVNFAEDFIFNLQYFKNISSVFVVGQALYKYRQPLANSAPKRQKSLQTSWADAMRAYAAYVDLFRDKGQEEAYRQDIHYYLLFLLDWTFLRQPLSALKKERQLVYMLCDDTQVQQAAKDASAYKLTVRIFRWALRHHCYFLVYWLRLARAIFNVK
ncbi:MAG: glycosyltransferase, partial [Ruthenibacterium sp.]